MKKIFSVLVLFIGIFLFGFNINSYASDKQYDVESATFDVTLREDGSALVNEKWEINFKKGEFTRFYVSRLKSPSEIEKYDDISVQSFKINDKECFETDDLDNRPEGSYSIVDNGKTYEYAWYFKVKNSKVTLTNSYILDNVVKYNDNGYAFFCYRFVGVDFEKTINNLNININAPSGANIEMRNDSKMDYELKKDSLMLKTTGSSGIVKVNIAMDKSVFSKSLNKISDEALQLGDKNEADSDDVILIILAVLLCIIFAPLTVILFIFYKKYRKRCKLAQDNQYMYQLINDLKMHNVTPYELSLIHGPSYVPVKDFNLIFLDLLRRGIFSISGDNIYINDVDIFSLKKYEAETVTAFNRASKADIDNKRFITMNDLLTILKDSNTIKNIAKSYEYKEIAHLRDKYKENYKVLKIYFDKYAKGYSSEMGEIIDNYINNNFIEIENLYYIACRTLTTTQNEDDFNRDIRNNSNYYYNDAFMYMNYHSHTHINNNNSSGSSCSSCSSCSGCGGGGAD